MLAVVYMYLASASGLRPCAYAANVSRIEWGECRMIRYRGMLTKTGICKGDDGNVDVQRRRAEIVREEWSRLLLETPESLRVRGPPPVEIRSSCEFDYDKCFIKTTHLVEQFGVCTQGRCLGPVATEPHPC